MNHYETLGVEPDASEEDINKAYKKLALILHPDHGGSAEDFKKAAAAHEVLSDKEKRAQYDQYGDQEKPPHYDLLAQLILACFQDPGFDPIAKMQGMAKQGLVETVGQINTFKTKKGLLEKRLKAFKSKNGSFRKDKKVAASNLVVSIIEHEIAGLENSIQKVKLHQVACQEVVEIVNGFNRIEDVMQASRTINVGTNYGLWVQGGGTSTQW